MSCITGKVRRVGDAFQGQAHRVGDAFQGQAHRVGDAFQGQAHRVGDELRGQAHRVGDELRGHASLVCTETGLPRLRVSPEIVWLTPDNAFEGIFAVVSNVDWKVEY